MSLRSVRSGDFRNERSHSYNGNDGGGQGQDVFNRHSRIPGIKSGDRRAKSESPRRERNHSNGR